MRDLLVPEGECGIRPARMELFWFMEDWNQPEQTRNEIHERQRKSVCETCKRFSSTSSTTLLETPSLAPQPAKK